MIELHGKNSLKKGVGVKKTKEVLHLYTAAEVAAVRKQMVDAQNGIDPILKEPFKEPPVLDHSHLSQHCRAALGRNTNAFEGRVLGAYKRCLKWLTDKPLPEILRNLAEYLEQDYSDNPLHPSWIKYLTTKFRALSEPEKKTVLKSMSRPEGANAKERVETFSKALKSRQFTMTQVEHILKQTKGNK